MKTPRIVRRLQCQFVGHKMPEDPPHAWMSCQRCRKSYTTLWFYDGRAGKTLRDLAITAWKYLFKA